MINNFTRNISFFQSLYETNTIISSKDIDNEFNNLIDYFNKKIVFSINNISAKNYNGIIGSNNYILKNIGNGKVIFDSLKDTNYLNNSINFDKIINLTPYSLIFIRLNTNLFFGNIKIDNLDIGGIFSNFSNKGNQNLFTYLTGKKIKNNNFFDNSILSENIDANTITSDHISPLGRSYLINKLLITANKIVNNSLTSSKFPFSISYEKLHPDIKNLRENQLTNLEYCNDSIDVDRIKNNSFDFNCISNNLLKFGAGILSKNIIPRNQILINIPDVQNPETIDTYALSSYSISNAFELKTYQNPRPDSIYVNPLFIQYNNQYNDTYNKYINTASTRDILYNNSVVNGVNAFSWVLSNPTHGFVWFFREVLKVSPTANDNAKLIKNLDKNYAEYWTKRRLADEYQVELLRLSKLIANTPRNLYRPTPPEIYQVLEPIINTKSYVRHRNHNTIKSKHLQNLTFNINNFLDRINHPNIAKNKLIGVNCLSQNLKTKLGL